MREKKSLCKGSTFSEYFPYFSRVLVTGGVVMFPRVCVRQNSSQHLQNIFGNL